MRFSRGWTLVAILVPNLLLGLWLRVVPDRQAFTTSQIVTLLHVLLGIGTLPLLILRLREHAGAQWTNRSRPMKAAARLLLTGVGLLALLSGFYALRGGEGMPSGTIHGYLGLAVAVPLALHLLMDGRVASALTLAVGFGLAVAGTVKTGAALPGVPAQPDTPRFAFETRPVREYDSAAWCGECHVEIYDEWKHSTHARSLVLPHLRDDMKDTLARRGAPFVDTDLKSFHAGQESAFCVHCHAPLTFYGDDPAPALQAEGVVNDGVSCSFCHTLRGLQSSTHEQEVPGPQAGLYISAPQTVRRYLGQGSPNPALRWLGNALIRWRPEMHRQDYHVPFLNTSEACASCHGLRETSPYGAWLNTSLASSQKPTHCQDCHMTRAMTGEPVREPGRLVAWGPERPQRRTHLFAGGNVQAGEQVQDKTTAEWERALSHKGVVVHLSQVHLDGEMLVGTVVIRNTLVGHRFPNMETQGRSAYITLSAFGADGKLLATTGERGVLDPGHQERFIAAPGVSPLLWETPDATVNTTLPYGEQREYELRVRVPGNAGGVARAEAAVMMAFDPGAPLATDAYVLGH